MVEIKIDAEKCTGCGTCVENCPVTVLEIQEKGGKKVAVIKNIDECIICRVCESTCDEQAITIIE